MHRKVLYLLGAGASANAIPVVQELTNALVNIKEMKRRIEDSLGIIKEKPFSHIITDEFIADCQWLGENARKNVTVDTFAKKLFLMKEIDQLSRLKCVLALFLLLRQITCGHDKRYDVFFTTIAQRGAQGPIIPSSVSIATWNYDNQIPISLWNLFSGQPSVFDIPNWLNVSPWVEKSEYLRGSNPDSEKATLIHTNGMASIIGSRNIENEYFDILKPNGDFEAKAKKIMEFHQASKASGYQANFLIDFAWEASEITSAAREKLRVIARDTDVLVVIGYSFPTFNREYDRELLTNASNLKKIYVQDSNPDPVRELISAIIGNPMEIVTIRNVNQFHIPTELRL